MQKKKQNVRESKCTRHTTLQHVATPQKRAVIKRLACAMTRAGKVLRTPLGRRCIASGRSAANCCGVMVRPPAGCPLPAATVTLTAVHAAATTMKWALKRSGRAMVAEVLAALPISSRIGCACLMHLH
jgi:hypothetical protein